MEGVSVDDQIRGVMQFSLAADRILGEFFDPEGLEGRGSDLRRNSQRGGVVICEEVWHVAYAPK